MTTPQAGPAPEPSKQQIPVAMIRLVVVGVLIVVAVVAGIVGTTVAERAKVGDCLAHSGSDDVKKVECTDPLAEYRVVSIYENIERPIGNVASMNKCFYADHTDSSFWEGRSGGKGRLLCLDKV